MLFKILDKNEFHRLVDIFLESNEVIGPMKIDTKKNGKAIHQYLPIKDFAELDLTYETTEFSAKTYFLPYKENLSTFRFREDDWTQKISYRLQPRAIIGLAPVCHNPFMSHIARLVECIHVTHESAQVIDELVQAGPAETMVEVKPRAGEGVGAVEVPRGILYHHCEYDKEGYVVRANFITPTTQNNANIHLDMPALAKHFATDGMTDDQLTLLCSMLVRSYDPCVSCSVH